MHAPVQPRNVCDVLGVAVSTTALPAGKACVQPEFCVQLIPEGVESTLPPPLIVITMVPICAVGGGVDVDWPEGVPAGAPLPAGDAPPPQLANSPITINAVKN